VASGDSFAQLIGIAYLAIADKLVSNSRAGSSTYNYYLMCGLVEIEIKL
jgi:hypothetical protein